MSTTPWQQAVHMYEPDDEGRCTNGWYNDQSEWVVCNSTQRSSVLHDDPEAEFRAMHDHGGGDCMCFEDESGPSYYEAMRRYCYPTDEEIAEDERRAESDRRRRRRINALSQGNAITRLLRRASPAGKDESDRLITRAMKLYRWGVRA